MTCHLQFRRPDDTHWSTILTSDTDDRAKLALASKRYQNAFAQHMGATDTEWRIIDDNTLNLERLPFLEHEASGPLVFLTLVVFISAVSLFGWLMQTGAVR